MNKIIIAGGRDFSDYNKLDLEVKKFILENKIQLPISIVSGTCDGADKLGEVFAKKYNFDIIEMSADWDNLDHPICVKKYRKDGTPYNAAAGHIRNEEMAKIATHCICFWDKKSKGTKNMIENAEKYKLIRKIINY